MKQEFFHSTIITRQPKPAQVQTVQPPPSQNNQPSAQNRADRPLSVFDKPAAAAQASNPTNKPVSVYDRAASALSDRPASVFDKPAAASNQTKPSSVFDRPGTIPSQQSNRPYSTLSPNKPAFNKSVSVPVMNNRPRAAAGTGAGKINALLDWCQECTQGYPGVYVENFTKSWQGPFFFQSSLFFSFHSFD